MLSENMTRQYLPDSVSNFFCSFFPWFMLLDLRFPYHLCRLSNSNPCNNLTEEAEFKPPKEDLWEW
jgi:hypothetical protein